MSKKNQSTPPVSHFLPTYASLPTKQEGKVFGTFSILVIIVGMVIFTLYMIKLDQTVMSKFEGKRWNIPAKVYSRPLEIYDGATINTKTLDSWLTLLNYRPNSKYNRTGSFHKTKSTYYIHSRGFEYGAGDQEKPQVIKLTISNNKVKNLQSTEPSKTGILRLEPVTIGGIYPDNNEDRVVVAIKDIPQPIIDALIATEDRSFYKHHGVSFRGIARAVKNNFAGKSMQGGSTITQQLIKNFYLNSERSLKRKANEALMAILLEIHYEKDDILQTYLNEINLGQNGNRSINGFGVASEFYFNRPLKELRIDQQALLVGLAKGPSYYNPRRHPKRALNRRNIVLHNMLVLGKIPQVTYDKAIKQPLDVSKKAIAGKSRFPDFLDIVKRELYEVYYAEDLKNEGLKIISTLDPLAQTSADNAVDKKLAQLRKKSTKTKKLEGALVSANPQTGELVAVVGSGSDFTGFNRAVEAKRQVGSLLKPVIYLTALQSGKYNLASSIDDGPITITTKEGEKWSPKNYGNREHGNVSLNTALAKSYNQASVRLGNQFGLNTFIKQLNNMGVANVSDYPASFLGSTNHTPMDMLGMYQVFATGGFRTPIHSIRSVIDSRGRVLQRSRLKTEQSVSSQANYLVNNAMQKVVTEGTAKSAKKLGGNLHLAGKTGTTNDYRDAWFAGYSGNYVTVVWVGRDDNKSIGLSGSTGALPVWVEYMKHLNLTPVSLTQPEGVEWIWLEDNDGRLSNEECPNAKYLPVISKYLKKEPSDCALGVYESKRMAEQKKWQEKRQAEINAQQQANAVEKAQNKGTATPFDPNAHNGSAAKPFNPNEVNNNEENNQNNDLGKLADKLLDLFRN